MKHLVSSLELLEARIAPAAVFVSATCATYTDQDGDHVTVKFTKPILTAANVGTVFHFNVGDAYLAELDLASAVAPDGTGISFTVVKVAGGDGLANVGYIHGTGHDLGAVTVKGDLGHISAGTDTASTAAIKSLAVRSMGRLGTDTQPGGSTSLQSDVDGALGSLSVTGDVKDAYLSVVATTAKIGPVTIGGSLIGGGTTLAGAIFCKGDIGAVKIGHDILGGAGSLSGSFRAFGKIASVSLGGSLIGGTGLQSGEISGVLGIGSVKIAHNIQGGTNVFTGELVSSSGAIGAITIGGSLLGGTGGNSGRIQSQLDMGALKIAHDIQGGSAATSGFVTCNGGLASLTVGGSIIGGTGDSSGGLGVGAAVGPVKIGHDLIGGSIAGSDTLDSSGFLFGGSFTSIQIGGSIISGVDNSSGSLTNNATIRSGSGIASLTVTGSLVGNFNANGISPVIISAATYSAVSATTDVAIGKISIGGRVEWANILAGFDRLLAAADADAQIGTISVKGDWAASSIAAGASAGPFGYGTGDTKQTGVKDTALLSSRIASITIAGQVFGTPVSANSVDHYGFVAEQIGAVKIGGIVIAVPADNNPKSIGETTDVTLHLIP